MKAENEQLLKQARNERDMMLKEARDTKDAIVNEARAKAQSEADRMITAARESIQNEKMAAITELKNQVAALSIEVAEKILKEYLLSIQICIVVLNIYINNLIDVILYSNVILFLTCNVLKHFNKT